MTFLIIKINEYETVEAGDLADPLYRLPSECVTVLINNLEQMHMRLQRWPNLSGGRQIIKLRPPDKLSVGRLRTMHIT